MKVVQGEYENGVVRLLEEVPQIKSKKVLITFFEEDDIEDEALRKVSLQQPKQFFQQYLSDIKEDLYYEFLNKKSNNRHLLSKQLQKESRLVQDESVKVLEEFEGVGNQD